MIGNISWDKVYRPKYQGGLGLHYPENNNKVLGAKIWRNWVTHKEEPWEKLGHIKYVGERKKGSSYALTRKNKDIVYGGIP